MLASLQKLFLLGMGILFFCPAVFSNPPLFNPMLLAPHPLLTPIIIPKHTPLTPLCPQGISIQLCLALTSFPLTKIPPKGSPSVNMYTPVLHQSQKISFRRKRRLLSRGKWRSYEYSKSRNTLRTLSEEERNTEPKEDYSRVHIENSTDNNTPTKVIREERRNGQYESSIGELGGVETVDLLVEERPEPPPVPSPEEKKVPKTKDIKAKKKRKAPPTVENKKTATPIVTDTVVVIPLTPYDNSSKPQCVDVRSGNTEAVSICIECGSNINQQLKGKSVKILGKDLNKTFNTKLSEKIKGKICHNQDFIKPIKQNFNKNCGKISFGEYVHKILVCEACANNVPPALMLSMMSLESSGICGVTGDDGSSHGLFQINISAHPETNTCNKGQKRMIKNSSLDQLKNRPECLGNPVNNIRQATRILKQKYKAVNTGDSDFKCNSHQMDIADTNKWRKALAAYNGGEGHVNSLKKMKKPEDINREVWDNMDEWQKIRTQYFFYRGRDSELAMNNLAHIEAALGSRGHATNQLNLFNSWDKVLGNKIDQSQCNR